MSGHRKAIVAKDFTDRGTGERFKKGDTPMIASGAFANYEAAGLVSAAPAVKPATAKPAPAKRAAARKTAKPADPKPTAAIPSSAADSAAAPAG